MRAVPGAPFDPCALVPLVQPFPEEGPFTAAPPEEWPQALGRASPCELANAGMPYRGRMLVAAAATTSPLLSFFRIVVFLLKEREKGNSRP
ncbi:hypothetical protein HDC93_006066 [Streptomyces sp. AK010]|nr:hypothetical protein [Streptomyces sp. AK010]